MRFLFLLSLFTTNVFALDITKDLAKKFLDKSGVCELGFNFVHEDTGNLRSSVYCLGSLMLNPDTIKEKVVCALFEYSMTKDQVLRQDFGRLYKVAVDGKCSGNGGRNIWKLMNSPMGQWNEIGENEAETVGHFISKTKGLELVYTYVDEHKEFFKAVKAGKNHKAKLKRTCKSVPVKSETLANVECGEWK